MTARDAQPLLDLPSVGGAPRHLPEVVETPGTVLDCPFLTDDAVSALVVAVAPPLEEEDGLQPRAGTVDAAARYGIDLAELADRSGGSSFRGAAGEVTTVDLPRTHAGAANPLPWAGLPSTIVLLGIGAGSDLELRRAGAALAGATRGLERVVSAAMADATPSGVTAFVEGYLLAAYRTPRFGGLAPSRKVRGPAPDPHAAAEQLVLLGEGAEQQILAARIAASATWLVRDLSNTPSNIKNPAWFAQQATELADAAGLETEVLGPRELVAKGFGGLLAVGAASASPPRLVTVTYVPEDAEQHVVLVGKGITYDTGGLSIKPREAMVPMKTDMAGAAVALAVVLGAAEAGVRHQVTAVLPLAENHFGADSYRPGDVLRTYSGRTVEVANTDAEGRLVLADALGYAVSELAPDLLIDVATLTGAASVGLGRGHAALYATAPELVAGLEAAATATGERVWHMPLVEDYTSALRSTVADLRHVPLEAGGGGSITAALFLREFTGGLPWVHLDIAGPARATASRHEVTEGATGYGARLVLRYLTDLR
ncbi:leucyl aminopeptidase family protein [Oerskovia enterophila]|uniref:leucyl aminopeptidase family protein n=1 Tax=Oerskovia enterophila TaxID=43678 RepID=UPI003398A30A